MENYSWPDPHPQPDYPLKTKPLPRELVHAVGVVVILWNEIENIHVGILQEMLGYGLDSGAKSFRLGNRVVEPMGNRQRGDLFRGAIAEISFSAEVSAALLAFQSYYDVCLGNRNLVAHSEYIEEEDGALISSYKATPHLSHRYIPDDADFWETTISDMHRVNRFGQDLMDAVFALHSPPPLPEIPPPPRDLLKYLQVHRIEIRQPRS
ncbi:MAG: hypothetical protein KF810_05330 [Rhizobiaceae bacterium]|nr:hypothetical protein [Rhizobiaceae bacterium]